MQMGSILYWRFAELSTAVTVVLVLVNAITVAVFLGALVRCVCVRMCARVCFHTRAGVFTAGMAHIYLFPRLLPRFRCCCW
jgi:hypothetical protein